MCSPAARGCSPGKGGTARRHRYLAQYRNAAGQRHTPILKGKVEDEEWASRQRQQLMEKNLLAVDSGAV